MKIVRIDYFKIYLLSATMQTPETNTISSLRAYENVTRTSDLPKHFPPTKCQVVSPWPFSPAVKVLGNANALTAI